MFMYAYCSTFSCFAVYCLVNRCINMYFKSILTHNDMPVHKRDTCVEFVKLHSVCLTQGPKAQCVKLVKAVVAR